MKKIIIAIIVACAALFIIPTGKVKAAALDEILNYDITVNVKDDATLDMYYHIDWKVLDSDSDGPLTWVKIGIPNKHCENIQALSDNIEKIEYSGSGGSYIEVYFYDKYYEGDVVSFDFYFNQDYMYQVNAYDEGYTLYTFTPGWFDDIDVDNLTLRWTADKIESFSPSCTQEYGYNVWNTSLPKGQKFEVNITYPNDAYGFDMSKTIQQDENDGKSTGERIFDGIAVVIGAIIMLAMVAAFIFAIVSAIFRFFRSIYWAATGFKYGYDTKVTRTRIEYYDSCPGCGAARAEGQKTCPYCGRSFVKSEEVIDEKNIKAEDKAALNYKRKGEYRYSSDPNVFVMVNTVRVARPAPPRSSSGRGGGSSCAHSSCACACACACAGGGRAGCTTKDFYNTNLKLKQIELKTKYKKKK